MAQPLTKQLSTDCDYSKIGRTSGAKTQSSPSSSSQKYFSYEEVFGDLEDMEFSQDEATQYLEISESEFKKIMASGLLKSNTGIDGQTIFPVNELSEFKKQFKNKRT